MQCRIKVWSCSLGQIAMFLHLGRLLTTKSWDRTKRGLFCGPSFFFLLLNFTQDEKACLFNQKTSLADKYIFFDLVMEECSAKKRCWTKKIILISWHKNSTKKTISDENKYSNDQEKVGKKRKFPAGFDGIYKYYYLFCF